MIDVKKITYGYDFRDMTLGQLHELLQAEELEEYESTLKTLVSDVSVTLVRKSIEDSWNTPKPKKSKKVDLPDVFEV